MRSWIFCHKVIDNLWNLNRCVFAVRKDRSITYVIMKEIAFTGEQYFFIYGTNIYLIHYQWTNCTFPNFLSSTTSRVLHRSCHVFFKRNIQASCCTYYEDRQLGLVCKGFRPLWMRRILFLAFKSWREVQCSFIFS